MNMGRAEQAAKDDAFANEETKKLRRNRRVFLFGVVAAAAMVVGLYARFVGFGGGSSDGKGEFGAEWFFPDTDPFKGEVFVWDFARGSSDGLSLRVVNALEDRWDAYFDVAVSEWNSGQPDVVALQTSKVGYDPQCGSSTGIMKVCNGNYGATSWKGQNSVLLNDAGYIVASVALMNDHYLDDDPSGNDKEYTMCHEIGHGLGLPHTDEAFWNIDRGNCMDYTSRPGNNKKPGAVSFEELAKVYSPTSLLVEDAAMVPASDGDDGRYDQVLRNFEQVTRNAQNGMDHTGFFDIGSGFSVVIYRLRV